MTEIISLELLYRKYGSNLFPTLDPLVLFDIAADPL